MYFNAAHKPTKSMRKKTCTFICLGVNAFSFFHEIGRSGGIIHNCHTHIKGGPMDEKRDYRCT